MAEGENIIPINIEDEMRGAYIDYSMSVIVSRALPDVRDGLKPVHRRVLFGMQELGLTYNKSYKKSARIVGEVLGKYHPHGDSSVYETMVRMAQEWSLRYMLVDGQGNYGSMDGDSAAAMRYTEARLQRIAGELLEDINKNTVDFQPNFDDSTNEPTVLPAKFPNLLVNGASGIAVGMATNMAPHNLTEVINGTISFIDNPQSSVEDLLEYIKAPDFPTGGIIYGYSGIKTAYATGKGRVIIRAKAEVEVAKDGKESIIVSEIPYMVNKATMIEKTASLINEKKIDGIRTLRDESDRNGVRVVYELKRDAIPNVVLNNLYKHTQLQSSFSINNVALVKGRPKSLNLRELIFHYVEHRHEVVTRRTQFELNEAEKRAHILEGYIIALDNLDEVIKLIRESRDPEVAKHGLMQRFGLSDIQAKAILEMRLQRLTGLERDKIEKEYKEIKELIDKLKEILANKELRMNIIKEELIEVRDRYGDDRRTEIDYAGGGDFEMEDMIPNEDVIVTVSNEGYIKRTNLSEYKTQSRGGRGSKGATTKTNDFTEHLFHAKTHNTLLIFTEFGKLFWIKVWKLQDGGKNSKGRAVQNLIQLEPEDAIRAFINVPTIKDEDYINNHFLVMITEKGIVKKTSLEKYSRPRNNGIYAISINEGDRLFSVELTNGDNHVIIALNSGRAINFHESKVRPMGRTATGVKGIKMNPKEEKVIGMVCANELESNLLVVSANGYGKRSLLTDYRITNRGGKGVKAMNITEKTGTLVAIQEVIDGDDLMIINKSGIIIRMEVDNLRIMGRNTQGVRLIKLQEGDEISSVTKVAREDESTEVEESAITVTPESELNDGNNKSDIVNDKNESENSKEDNIPENPDENN